MSFAMLRPGDTVGIVAPAGPIHGDIPTTLAAIEALYARHGLRAHIFPGCHARTGYLAGPDALRLSDLHAALADERIAAIHCLRGGYGCMRLLGGIDIALLRRHPKLLVGYSDVTALHACWAREGLPSLHAPMPASDLVKPGREDDETALFDLLLGGCTAGITWAPALDAAAPRIGGSAEGMLIGGNLSLVAALVGTPWAWRAEGAILFLEDVSEELYRADRYLAQLRLAGVLAAAGGFVLGSFTESESPRALLHDTLAPLGKPVLGGWPSGHGTPNRPLPLGLHVRLDATAGTLTLLQDLLR